MDYHRFLYAIIVAVFYCLGNILFQYVTHGYAEVGKAIETGFHQLVLICILIYTGGIL